MKGRYLARRVLHRGREYGLSLVEIDGTEVHVLPFAGETHSTVFVDGTLVVLRAGAVGPRDWHRPGDNVEIRME